MHKQTYAFLKLSHWTDAASQIYHANKGGGRTDVQVPSLEPIIDIKLEGELKGEIKDIIEELDIILNITKTQRQMLVSFISNADLVLDPSLPSGKKMESQEEIDEADIQDDYNWFKRNADERLEIVTRRIEELQDLRNLAVGTAENVR